MATFDTSSPSVARVLVKLDSDEHLNAISELNVYPSLHLGKSLIDHIRHFIDFPAELVSIEMHSTIGTSATVCLKPSKGLLDLLAAVRASNFEGLIVE
jgi:hypothetical protein